MCKGPISVLQIHSLPTTRGFSKLKRKIINFSPEDCDGHDPLPDHPGVVGTGSQLLTQVAALGA